MYTVKRYIFNSISLTIYCYLTYFPIFVKLRIIPGKIQKETFLNILTVSKQAKTVNNVNITNLYFL